MRHVLIATLGIAFANAACSAAMPPPQLVDARAAYNKAAEGPAAKLDPAGLHVASEQLALAEKTFDKDGDTPVTRDQAYVAERRAELADVKARTVESDRKAGQLAQDAQATQARELETTRAQLSQTRSQLAAAAAAMNQLAAMKTVQAVKQEDRRTVITLSGSVLFASAKDDLLPSAEGTLEQVAAALAKSDPNASITVQGYTDSQGNDAFNEALSQRRADRVRAFLTTHGLEGSRVKAEGLGKSRPVADNSTPEGRANNRRVEIVVEPSNTPTSPAMPSSTTTTSTTTLH